MSTCSTEITPDLAGLLAGIAMVMLAPVLFHLVTYDPGDGPSSEMAVALFDSYIVFAGVLVLAAVVTYLIDPEYCGLSYVLMMVAVVAVITGAIQYAVVKIHGVAPWGVI